jgi:hypothetical protein
MGHGDSVANEILVGGIPTPLKILVSWDDYFQYMRKNMFQTTNHFFFFLHAWRRCPKLIEMGWALDLNTVTALQHISAPTLLSKFSISQTGKATSKFHEWNQ